MDSQAFRKAAYAAIDHIVDYYDTLDQRKVLPDVEPGYLRPLLPDGPPEQGEAWEAIHHDLIDKILPGITHWQSPNFMAFYPASSTYPAILGELYSAALTAPAFNWICSPAVTELETIVLDWLARMLNLPDGFQSAGEGGGVIQGTASEAMAVVVVAARERYLNAACADLEGDAREKQRGEVRNRLVALGSNQTHSSLAKAAAIAGVRHHAIDCSFDVDFSLTGPALEAAVKRCQQDGLIPFFVNVNLGTTNTAAVDRFREVRHVLSHHTNIWVHVDAAYAGSAMVCEEYQHLTADFGAFDSFNVNLHKWLCVNFDASALFVQHRQYLKQALCTSFTIYDNKYSASGLVTDYRDWQIPLGRRFRALKIWFVMRSYGVAGLQAHIRKHVELGKVFTSLVQSRPDLFVVLATPAFALTVLGMRDPTSTAPPAGEPLTRDTLSRLTSNALTKRVYEAINAERDIFISSCDLSGIEAMRFVSANPLADEPHVRRAFAILVRHAEAQLALAAKH